MERNRYARHAIVLTVSALALAGCSGGEEPTTTPSAVAPTTTAATATTPAPTPASPSPSPETSPSTETATPVETTSPSAEATASVSDTATAATDGDGDAVEKPVRPADTFDDAGALAFARYYIDMNNYAYDIRDGSALREICLPEAGQCQFVADGADKLKTDDVYLHGGDSTFTVNGLVISEAGPETKHVDTTITFDALEFRKADGTVLEAREGYDLAVKYILKWQDDKWILAEGVRTN